MPPAVVAAPASISGRAPARAIELGGGPRDHDDAAANGR